MTRPTVATSPRGQAMAPAAHAFGPAAFGPSDTTVLRWLGMAGFLVNSRGTTLMIDPLLGAFDMPLLVDVPITAADVPHLDAVLITHSDNDHCSLPTLRDLARATAVHHCTPYVASLLTTDGLPARGHAIGATVDIGPLQITLTPADHAWQNETLGTGDHVFTDDDACGFWIRTPDGTIWAPGDSRLIRDHHLTMPAPDAMLFDFSDSDWHFGLTGAVEMANTYPDTALLLHHWGSVDAPDFAPFNGNPDALLPLIVNPDRIRLLAPGEPFQLRHIRSPDTAG